MKPAVVLYRLIEAAPDGTLRCCGWTGPDADEADTWVEEMNACFPESRHWHEPVFQQQ